MSHPEHDDEQDRGAQVVPFPGARQLPDVLGDAGLEPAEVPLEGELVDDAEYVRRTTRPVPVVVHHLVHVIRESAPTGSAGRATVRAGVTVGQGFTSWARRGWDSATLGVYRWAIEAAEAVGDHERLADWTARREQVRERRHRRWMDAPKLAVGLGIVAGVGLLAVVVLWCWSACWWRSPRPGPSSA